MSYLSFGFIKGSSAQIKEGYDPLVLYVYHFSPGIECVAGSMDKKMNICSL